MFKENTRTKMIGRHLLTLRNIILLCVLLQNAGYVLIRKYSTITENVSSKEILLVAEVFQLIHTTTYLPSRDQNHHHTH